MMSSFCSTVMSRWMRSTSSPFGPLTRTDSGSMATVTPAGTVMGLRPMRLMRSPNLRHDFAADASAAGLVAGHDALRRRDDGGAHAAEHLGDAGGGDVVALARTRRALQPGHDGLAVLGVLELDADQRAGVVSGRRLGLPGLDVALLLEDAGHLALELGRGDLDDVVLRTDRVADPRQVVGDRIGHRHGYQLDFVMPGMKPLCASSRRQMRHTPNLRYTARERPQRRQRVYSRVLYLDPRCWRTFWDVLATV